MVMAARFRGPSTSAAHVSHESILVSKCRPSFSCESPDPKDSHCTCNETECEHEAGFDGLEMPEPVFGVVPDVEAVDALAA